MRTRKTFYNSLTGILYYLVTVIIGIVNRKVLINILGIQYQGINGLFSDVLFMLSVAELGLGTAIIYHLYKPLAQNHISEIKALMRFYKRCYYGIALAVLLVGIALMPFLQYFVDGSSIPISLSSIYIWYLLDVVCSYLFSYKRSMLIADQNNYVINMCNILYQLASKIIQIVLLILTENFMYFLVTMVVCRLAENLLINFVCNRKYPFLKDKNIEKLHPTILADIIQKVKGAFLHRIGAFAVLGSSNIIISKYLGLVSAGIYSNYTLIINVLTNVSAQMITSATASVGQLLTEKDNKKINSIFQQLMFLNAGLLNFLTVGLFCVINFAIELFFGTDFIVSQSVVFAMAINFYLQGMRKVFHMYKETSGILYEDRFIPLLEAAINLLFGIFLVKKIGLAGILWGSVISSFVLYFYTYPILVCKRVLKMPLWNYFKQLIIFFVLMLISMTATDFVVKSLPDAPLLLLIAESCMICLIIPNGIFLLYARKKEAFQLVLKRAVRLFGKNNN